jgi:hypothetical protein
LRATGAALLVPYLCTMLAAVSTHPGHTEDGLGQAPGTTSDPAEPRHAGDGLQRSLVPRSRFQPRLMPDVRVPWQEARQHEAGLHRLEETVMEFSTVVRLLTLAVGLCVVPLGVDAQPAGQVVRVGMLNTGQPRATSCVQAFETHLRELGYVEDQNLVFEYRTAEGHAERLPDLAAALVQRHLDVLVATGPEAVLRASRQATSTLPIVMVAIDYDPIARGYVAGLP